MLLVNNPGRWSDTFIYPALRHTEWNGWTPTDLIFPNFLFIMGVALVFSFGRRLDDGHSRVTVWHHVTRRALVLVLLGLFQSRFPCYPQHPSGLGDAMATAGFGGGLLRVGLLLVLTASVVMVLGPRRRRFWFSVMSGGLIGMLCGQILARPEDSSWFWQHLVNSRVPGVLVRIGICYFLAGSLYLVTRRPRVLVMVTGILLVTTAIWTLWVPIPGFGRPDLDLGLWQPGGEPTGLMSNWCTFVDTHVFGVRCLYTSVDPVTAKITWAFDPEGLASTPTALATVLMGILCGIWLRRVAADSSGRNRRRVVAGLLLTAVMLAVAGTQLGAWLPVNKQLWTSSYAMFTAGTALILLLAWNALLATERRHRWATPFIWYGRNAIVAFFLSSLAARLLVHLKVAAVSEAASVQHVTLKAWIFANFYLSWLAPREASLLYALSVVLLWAGVCGLLYRRRIFVKI